MPVALEFLNFIIPVEKIESHYPGGFSAYKTHYANLIGGRVWFDNYLVRDGAMNPMDMELLVGEWESYGLKGATEENGVMVWKDFCVTDTFGIPTLRCNWLIVENQSARHTADASDLLIRRDNMADILQPE
jgi:hypothetical protein